jgi:hypothetical protein
LTAIGAITHGRLALAAEECAVPEVSVLWAWSGGEMPPEDLPTAGWDIIDHPTNPLLAFYAPDGWTEAVLAAPVSVEGSFAEHSWAGIRATSADATTAVEIATVSVPGTQDSAAAAQFGLDAMFPGRSASMLCSAEFANGAAVIVADVAGTLVFVSAVAHAEQTLNATGYVYYAAAAPRSTFAQATQDAFIAIFYQMYR